MGQLTVLTVEEYRESLRRLFPRGSFWDEQFSNADSDVSRLVDAKAEELLRFKARRAELLEEGYPATTTELIENWESGLGIDNSSMALDQRRQALVSVSAGSVNGGQLAAACAIFGGTLDALKFPFTPAFFGRTRFGSRLATPAALNTVYLYITLPDVAQKAALETIVTGLMLASSIITFFYKDATNVYVP